MYAQYLFLLSLFTLPLQLNKYINTNSSLVFGIPIDYRTPAIYFSDFAILATVTVFFLENKKFLILEIRKNLNIITPAILLCAYLFTSSFYSDSKEVSIFSSLKITEATLFALVAVILLTKKKIYQKAQRIFKIVMVWQSALVILQFTLQRSIGLYFLGERTFDITTSQIATVNLMGRELLRGYGTFPHPNVLGAFLLISAVISGLKFHWPSKNTKKRQANRDNIVLILTSTAIVLTFSKTAILLMCLYFVWSLNNVKNKIILSTLLVFVLGAYFFTLTSTYINTIAERISLVEAALKITSSALVHGVGQNNFIVHLASLNIMTIGEVRLLQPVHNVFLLILAENGLIGFALFTLLIFKVFERSTTSRSLLLSVMLLAYLSIDHFLWTLHQGIMLLFLASAFIYNSKKSL